MNSCCIIIYFLFIIAWCYCLVLFNFYSPRARLADCITGPLLKFRVSGSPHNNFHVTRIADFSEAI